MAHVYGYRPDPVKADGESSANNFSLQLAPKLTQVTAGDPDLRPFCTVTNQYDLESCTGNATADSVEVLNAIQGLSPVQLSRMFVWTLARNMDGNLSKNEGTHIRNCFQVLASFGICREDLASGQGGWPYDSAKVGFLPDVMSMRAATGHRIHSYYRIVETGQARIDKMLEALRAHHPVVFGTQVDDVFEGISDMTPWKRPAGAVKGGHAMMVVGYITGKGFIVKNSWGPDWGENGFCIMAEEVFTWNMTEDIWVPTNGMNFKA